MATIEPRFISRPWPAPKRFSWHRFPPLNRLVKWDAVIKLAMPLLLLVLVGLAVKCGSFRIYLELLQAQTYTAVLPALGAGYTLLMLLLQGLRTVLWARYRPYPLSTRPLPRLTVIMPAYNEGQMVAMALDSVVQADYPRERLEIICVDDGSTDDTWDYIDQVRRRFPHLIKTIRWPQNRGKKQALYAGFKAARGEILVTVDSDSVIEPAALRHLVAPLQDDPTMGAVAGNVRVYNRHQSFMGKMQGVRFVNLDFLRASQSLYKTVICTPGSLSAYRRAAIMPVIEAWLRQTFLGAPCHHSEDRALTNFILKAGYYTCYQRSALVYTLVPETYRGVCRMYLRWERGNVRESCLMLAYLFTRYRQKHRVLPIVECILTQLEGPLAAFFFTLLLFSLLVYPAILFKLLLLLGLMSVVGLIYYLYLERDLEFVYGVVYAYYAFFFLQWIYPYAFLTVRDRRWLTR
ncbi:MAG: glycosyltransferase family 2 protein [Thermodesulfobacteriota bacterium]